MTLIVPGYVAGGASHSAETFRGMIHAISKGTEGVTGPTDLKVAATSTPGTTVTVASGTAIILGTYPLQTGQSYTARNDAAVSVGITATGGTARSDMLILRIDDPQYGGSTPPSIPLGPYAKFEIISNVGAGAVNVPGSVLYPAIPLARIDIPSSTSAITNAMIVDLRSQAGYEPVTEAKNVVIITNPAGRGTVNFSETFPAPPVVTITGGNGELFWIVSVNSTSFTFEARPIANPAVWIASGPVRLHYHAVEEH